jgi:hypothetical protein
MRRKRIMTRKLALGEAHQLEEEGVGVAEKPVTLQERVEALENQVFELIAALNEFNRTRLKDKREQERFDEFAAQEVNKDGIPIGTILMGKTTKFGGLEVFLTVRSDGYYIGEKKQTSLSAAAENVSGVRRSGLVFWKLPDGRTVKEAFGK